MPGPVADWPCLTPDCPEPRHVRSSGRVDQYCLDHVRQYNRRPRSRRPQRSGHVDSPAFAHFMRTCAICGAIEDLVGDHDPVTRSPRGILCRRDNSALGFMNDDPKRLRTAADYVS